VVFDINIFSSSMILVIYTAWNKSIYQNHVVATTRPVSNSSTSNKSQRQISSGEHELYNSQENSTENHNSILPTIYINYSWSMLQLHICCASYPNVYILSSCPLLIYLMSYYSSCQDCWWWTSFFILSFHFILFLFLFFFSFLFLE